MSLVSDLADTLRAVVAGRATGLPIDPILPQVKAVLERAEGAIESGGGLTDREKVRLEAAVHHAETIVGSTHNIYEMRWMHDVIDRLCAQLAEAQKDAENWRVVSRKLLERADKADAQLAEAKAEIARLKPVVNAAACQTIDLYETVRAADRRVKGGG